jgi:L-serine dehydratase
MQAIKELYKIGKGPSSSHTLAPERACRYFAETYGAYPYYQAELFGSLSLTGKGHQTDEIIRETLPGETEIIFSLHWQEKFPNGFYLRALDDNKKIIHTWTVFSLGGGSIQIKEHPLDWNDEIYSEKSLAEIMQYCKAEKKSFCDYIYDYEPGLHAYLGDILGAMISCVERGLHTEGILPGRLHMERSAKHLYDHACIAEKSDQKNLKLMAFAYAASEENAAGHTCVTAPTLGACGVMASYMYYCSEVMHIDKDHLIDALAVGGLFGNLIKANATISGAVGGCQAEVGAAVSMTAASCAYLLGLDQEQIEYAAEIGMEHNLGLTCDPVMGYVMIPCIERNAMGVLRAVDSAQLSKYMSSIRRHLISFDLVVKTMNDTGKQIPIELKETSEGGLAKEYDGQK